MHSLKAPDTKVSFWGYSHLSGQELKGSAVTKLYTPQLGVFLPKRTPWLAFSVALIRLHSKRDSPEFKYPGKLFCDGSDFYLTRPPSSCWSMACFSMTYCNSSSLFHAWTEGFPFHFCRRGYTRSRYLPFLQSPVRSTVNGCTNMGLHFKDQCLLKSSLPF